MALVTVQRSPSPSRAQRDDEDEQDVASHDHSQSRKGYRSQRSFTKLVKTVNTIKFVNRLRFSESYFTIKGAALILPKSEKVPQSKKRTRSKSSSQVTDIQTHLQWMCHQLRPDDTIQVAIKLESNTELARYLAIVVTEGEDGQQEGVIIGMHCCPDVAYIGLVLPVYQNTRKEFDGDGGFRILTEERSHIFKPISVQALWSAIMSLDKVCQTAKQSNQTATHGWVAHYVDKMTDDQSMLNEWDMMEDLMVAREPSPGAFLDKDTSTIEQQIRVNLRELLTGYDLEEVTSYELEQCLDRSLKEYRSFIDQEMLLIIRQLDAASQIFDFVYLGSEWNACNLQELQENGIGYILNVTKEIDNFFPGMFKYMNVRLYDDECSNLMKSWENTHGFICKARKNNSKILVHCKMGVSRSASTVIAFAMKEFNWSLEHALHVVQAKRSVIKPNDSFMQQLQTYEGILMASKNRSIFSNGSEVQQAKPEPQEAGAAGQGQSTASHTTSDKLQSDSDSEEASSGSTTNYSLDEDSDTASSADDGRVVGLHYSKLSSSPGSDILSATLSNTHSLSDAQAADEQASSAQLGGTLDVSVCYGLVRKTKEKIAHNTIQTPQTSEILPQEAVVPVTPGTVRKVLVEIEQKSELDGVLCRSASLRLHKRVCDDTDSIQRSASLRLKRVLQEPTQTSRPATHPAGGGWHTGVPDTPTGGQKEEQDPVERVRFSIGDCNLDSNLEVYLKDIASTGLDKSTLDDTSLDESAIGPMVTSPVPKSSQSLKGELHQQTSHPTDHILRVSSKPCFLRADDDSRTPSPMPVKALVGAFEDIGVARRHLTRPLTIHVDSFASDPFAHPVVSPKASTLTRSQSLQIFTAPAEIKSSKKSDKLYNLKTSNPVNPPHLRPYWRIKMDSAKKLIHSFSSTTVNSKDSS
ncbi:protein phosphatase Slingshot homolog 1-like isoform X2 [Watersipora subatra]|uniref:protein phosphatase Slingshot homolog 1-like isoform X2 n=1 Tax=Watersipora subatra TaxID=2589382 RepID=UPI00355BD705